MADCGFDTFQPKGHVGIDATDERRLNKFRQRCLELLPGRVQPHTSRDAAVAYCKSRTGVVNLMGHGRPGLVGTGCGDPGRYPPAGEFLDAANLGDWSGTAASAITVIACNVACGSEGLDLLRALAAATGVAVTGSTGFVWIGAGCTDMYLEPGTSWLTVPAAGTVAVPCGDLRPIQANVGPVQFATTNAFTSVPLADLQTVALRSASGETLETWTGDRLRECLAAMDLRQPLFRGSPLAFETGTVEVTLRIANVETQRSYAIFNDRFLRDRSFPGVYYRCDIERLRRP
jgi:hypothetical protein